MKINEVNYNWNGTLKSRKRTDYIVLHHAEASSCSVMDIDKWHKSNGWTGIGYHFFVRKNGEIYRGRPIDKEGAHVLGKNSVSLGICAEGSFLRERMNEVQKKSICELLVYLKDKFYPNAQIVGHGEVGDSNCPGINFPLKEIKDSYRKLAKADELEDKADIVAELGRLGIITNSALWLNMAGDANIYWLLRKLCHYIRTKSVTENEKNEYTDLSQILWDLNYRGIISDIALWEKKAMDDTNIYYLMRKGLHYIRTH